MFSGKHLGGGLVQSLRLPAWKVGDRWFVPHSGIQVLKKQMFLLRSLVNIQYCGFREHARPQNVRAGI